MEQRGTWHLAHVYIDESNGNFCVNAFKSISEDENAVIEQACREIRRFMSCQNVVASVLLNRNDLLESCINIGAVVLRNEMNEIVGKNLLLDVSRKLANLQSIFRSFIDHYTRLFKNKFGIASTEYQQWQSALSNEYDREVAYRVFAAMRNYIQHYDMPPLSFASCQQAGIEGATIRIDLDIKAMMEDPRFRKKIGSSSSEKSRCWLRSRNGMSFQRIVHWALPQLATGLEAQAKNILSHRPINALGERGHISPVYILDNSHTPEFLKFSLSYLPEDDAKLILAIAGGEAWLDPNLDGTDD